MTETKMVMMAPVVIDNLKKLPKYPRIAPRMVKIIKRPKLKDKTVLIPFLDKPKTIPPTKAAQVLKPASRPKIKKAGVPESVETLKNEKRPVFWIR